MKPRVIKPTKSELHRQKIRAAMPEVRTLCDKHGRSIVLSCVNRISEYEKKSAQIERLRAEAETLQKRLMAEAETAIAV